MGVDLREWKKMLSTMDPRLRPSLEKARADPEQAFTTFIQRGYVPSGGGGGRSDAGEPIAWQQNALRKLIGAFCFDRGRSHGCGLFPGRARCIASCVTHTLSDFDPVLRRRAFKLDSGYLQALVAGVVDAPRQIIGAQHPGLDAQSCCGTVKVRLRLRLATVCLRPRARCQVSRSSIRTR